VRRPRKQPDVFLMTSGDGTRTGGGEHPRRQDRHVEYGQPVAKKAAPDAQEAVVVSPDTPNVLQAIIKLDQTKTRSQVSHKVALGRRRKRILLKKQWKN
jgi:hypothetical protein